MAFLTAASSSASVLAVELLQGLDHGGQVGDPPCLVGVEHPIQRQDLGAILVVVGGKSIPVAEPVIEAVAAPTLEPHGFRVPVQDMEGHPHAGGGALDALWARVSLSSLPLGLQTLGATMCCRARRKGSSLNWAQVSCTKWSPLPRTARKATSCCSAKLMMRPTWQSLDMAQTFHRASALASQARRPGRAGRGRWPR